MKQENTPPSGLNIYAFTVVALGIVFLAFIFSPTNDNYNPADVHKTATEKGYSETVVSMPDKVDPVANATKSYTATEKEKYIAERSDLAAQWATAKYTFVGLIMGGIGLLFIALTLRESRNAAWFAEQALIATKDASRRELRAYLSVQNVKIMGKAALPTGTNGTLISFDIINSGQTPAYSVSTAIKAIGVSGNGLAIDDLSSVKISAGGFSQIHNGIPRQAEYEGEDIDFEKMIGTEVDFAYGERIEERRYLPNAKIQLIIILEYFDAFSIESGDDSLRFREVFLYVQHLPTISSEMWPEAITENNKQIT